MTNMMDMALEFARHKHKGQYRSTKEEYINHPMRVANYVRKYKKSHALDKLLSAAYLHDTLEDTDTTYYELIDLFGPSIASIVLELTTDEDIKHAIGKTDYLKFKMKNMSSWALTIKLCDRLDNCSDLNLCTKEFRIKYTKETLSILDYLLQNRTLSNTQYTIVEEILKRIEMSISDKDKPSIHKLRNLMTHKMNLKQ